MLRSSSMRRSTAAAVRRLSTQRPDAPVPGLNKPVGSTVSTGAKPTAPPTSTPSSATGSKSSSGPGVGTLLLLTTLSTPAGVAVYLKQNPEWNPEPLRYDANWIKFRELVLGNESKPQKLTNDKQIVTATKPVAPKVTKPKEPAKTPEELSALISKANPAATLEHQKQEAKPEEKPVVQKKAAVAKKQAKAVAAEPVVEKKAEEVKAKVDEVVVKVKEEAAPVEKVEVKIAKEEAKAPVAVAEKPIVKEEKPSFVKKVEEAVEKERAALNELAHEATSAVLGGKIDKHIQTTTKEIVETLQAEASEAAIDMDKNYLSGIHELDTNALVIRVAQLATEMKHRSKWEAVRLVEALRRMEEDAKKKSTEVLERQQALHKELLERELRLQHETLTRASRDEMEKLKKQYAEDLARNVNTEKASILKSLQEKFAADKKAIEDKFTTQLKAKSESFQETLTKERKQRVQELENYRAQLRALNSVLERTSTYEAFSHQVHKASMAALALSDRIEAAMPLRTEIRALREFARNDPLIDAALKSLPEHVIDEGAPSVSQLQERFKTVKAVGRRAAMVPEGSGLVGQMFGGALSYLIIPPGGPIEGDAPDAVFSRADYALKAGDIEKAVAEMKTLKGNPAEVSRDWVAAAEDRLAVEQTAKVVKAHISLLAASCS